MSNQSCNMVTPVPRGKDSLCLTGENLTHAQVVSVASSNRPVSVSETESLRARLRKAENLVDQAVDNCWRVYGLTTGFGGMADVEVPPELAEASQRNLLSFLSCGAGKPVADKHVRAAMLLRANMLMRGASGVRLELIERYARFLNEEATPVVLELGSIGASGDLVPLAAIARAITGEGFSARVRIEGREVEGGQALEEIGLAPLSLRPKEALAMINGTTFSAAIASNCLSASRDFLGITLSAHAMMIRALQGHEDPFDPFVHDCKPHPGQGWVAGVMRDLLGLTGTQAGEPDVDERHHLQDRYSLRCLPQYLGPIVENLARIEKTVATEMNSVTDNPLIDSEGGRFLQSGNFLGQYVGMAMDDLRRCLGLMAKHLDVQIALLVSPEFNHGLPPSLVGNEKSPVNMGLKGLQITGNSIMPMLTYLGNPVVEHFPTHAEQYNQNVNGLSWGSANLADQSVELYTSYAAVALIFAVQAIDLRAKADSGSPDGRKLLTGATRSVYEAIYNTLGCTPGGDAPLIFDDRDHPIERLIADLGSSIEARGPVVEAITPILDLFDGMD